MSVAKMLKGHELFRSLSFEEVERVSSFSGLKEYGKDEIVFDSGVVGSHIFVLQRGYVSLRLPAAAHEASFVAGRLERGDMFGLSPLLGPGRHTATAQCTEACTVLAIEAEPFRCLLEENAGVGLHIMNAMAREYFSRYIETLTRLQRVVNEIAAI